MKKLPIQGRTLAMIVVIIPLLVLFVYVGLRSGPLAPIEITVVSVESRAITPALFGIGTVEARYTYKIGPTIAGRIKRLDIDEGDKVSAGQMFGEMEAIDLDDKVLAQDAALSRAKAVLQESQARQTYAQSQARRYEKLYAANLSTEEVVATKRQELEIATAALTVSQQELSRAKAEHKGMLAQRNNLQLIAPVDGVVSVRNADPGTTVVAGQSVVEIIDPKSIWINVRFDQISAAGLASGLRAQIELRSRSGKTSAGKILRVELKADSVTEEMLAKVVFDTIPNPLPPLGELAEVTVDLPVHASAPSIPNASVHRVDGKLGVWQITNDELQFTPVQVGAQDLDGFVQINEGLNNGDQIVLYTAKAITANSRFNIVDTIAGLSK